MKQAKEAVAEAAAKYLLCLFTQGEYSGAIRRLEPMLAGCFVEMHFSAKRKDISSRNPQTRTIREQGMEWAYLGTLWVPLKFNHRGGYNENQ